MKESHNTLLRCVMAFFLRKAIDEYSRLCYNFIKFIREKHRRRVVEREVIPESYRLLEDSITNFRTRSGVVNLKF